METLYLTKIPIFDNFGKVNGFEIRYEFEESEEKDLNVLIRKLYKILSDVEITKKVDGKPIFIQLATDLIIFTEFTSLLPQESFIIKISSSGIRSKSLLEKLKELRLKDYRFCLSEVVSDTPITDITNTGLFEYVELNAHTISIYPNLNHLINENFVLIADNVDSYEDFESLKKMGFKLFKGDFFTKPEKIETSIDNFSKIETLRLIRVVHEEDDLNKIAEYIKGSPAISVSLLRYINSSFFYLANPITSVNRAVIYLGKKNLLNWLILLSMMSIANNDIKREVVKKALFRAKFMELVSKRINSDENISDMAFLVGILSLGEAIFNVQLEEIVSKINLNKNIVSDIREKNGFFGKLLNLVEMVEKNKTKDIKDIATDLTLEVREIGEVSIEALKWGEDMFMTLYR